jgi:mycothiol synthase
VTPTTSPVRVDPTAFDWADTTGVAEGIRRLVDEATRADGQSPLDEAALLSLRHAGLSASALWVAGRPGADLTGFALTSAHPGAGEVQVDLAVRPDARGQGVARDLAYAVLAEFGDASVSAWSHGNHPGAAALASELDFRRTRDLWVMRRSLAEPLPEVKPAGASVVRPFEPGRDEQAFLEANAAAFAHHPEQGGLTRADLDQRMAEDWFDPAGFFLAFGDGRTGEPRLLGFHWTKVHAGDRPYGEVYVVGVSPDAQGLGLGRTLTLTGLHHLRSLGLAEVILYVESDNAAAVAVYRGLGFTHAEADTHVMYTRLTAARP